MSKVSLAKGTRDFGPEEMRKRNFIFDTLSAVFKQYGFSQIETPAMENLDTLLGKYGDEGDSLLFKILDSGDFLSNLKNQSPSLDLKDLQASTVSNQIASKGLRYDLTVPFARFVSMNRHRIQLPFRRFQMQPVWRADRPQKGRYREFWQCDADCIGSDSLLNEADLIHILSQGFSQLGLSEAVIHLNNRKILEGITESIGALSGFREWTVVLDKFDKIGKEGVEKEWLDKGFTQEQVQASVPFLAQMPFNSESLAFWQKMLQNSTIGLEGVNELNILLGYLTASGYKGNIILDGTLARGLSYYTGCIMEVKIPDSGMGSVAAGGRYDNLTGVFGVQGLSGVGISFGADRIYDLLEQRNLFPLGEASDCKVLFCSMGEEELLYALPICQQLRENKIACKVYPKAGKLKKQLDYANAENIPLVVIIGEEERMQHKLTIKNLKSGTQETIPVQQLHLHIHI